MFDRGRFFPKNIKRPPPKEAEGGEEQTEIKKAR
jgi:hypothetical protein